MGVSDGINTSNELENTSEESEIVTAIENPVTINENNSYSGTDIQVKISYYKPQLGGTNCSRFVNGECVSKMANGEDWRLYYNTNTIACPSELAFGTQIVIFDNVYTCRDRGGAIINNSGVYWVDVLGDPIAPFGTVVDAIILN